MKEVGVLILCIVVSVTIGLVVLAKNTRSLRHQLYGILAATIMLLGAANTAALTAPVDERLFHIRSVMALSAFSLYVAYLFLISIDDDRINHWRILLRRTRVESLTTVGILALSYTPFLFTKVDQASNIYPVPSYGIILYVAYFLVIAWLCILIVMRGMSRAKRLHDKAQYRSVLIGSIPIAGLAPITNIILPVVFHNTDFIFATPLYSVFFEVCIGYAIIHHGLLNIKSAMVRTGAYGLSVLSLAAIYVATAYVTSSLSLPARATNEFSISALNILLALVLAILFQPVKRFFDRWTNRIFYHDEYDADEFVAHFGTTLTRTSRLDEIMSDSLAAIVDTLKAEGGMIAVWPAGSNNDPQIVTRRMTNRLSKADNELIERVISAQTGGVIRINSDIHYSAEDVERFHQLLTRQKVALVLPLMEDRQRVGYLMLREQYSNGYTRRDLKTLEMISNELVIAIMNARSVEEVRDLNKHLEERVSAATKELRTSNQKLREMDATKDEFVSMASHQLRTPLTSVKGYISMVLEGDAGDISPTQRQLLEEAFTSSERMVHLIGDFLNVSRLQTGKFMIEPHLVDLGQIVKQEVEGMRQIAMTHDIKLTCKVPRIVPQLYLDEGKLRQVIMNFIDNAVYYSPERTTIRVTLTIEDGGVVLRVIDHGMGVPREVQQKLFSKFFRAENARKQRPDGTGIGLYLAKKIIDGHGGKVVFESEINKGSTFGFRLPIRKLFIPPRDPIETA